MTDKVTKKTTHTTQATQVTIQGNLVLLILLNLSSSLPLLYSLDHYFYCSFYFIFIITTNIVIIIYNLVFVISILKSLSLSLV